MESRNLMQVEAAGRAAIYGVFARLFMDPLDCVTLASLGTDASAVFDGLVDLGVDAPSVEFIRAACLDASDARSKELAVEYAALFEAHGRIHPFASCWVPGAKPLLLGPPAAAAQSFYTQAGVGLDSANAYRADHVGIELGFLALLAQRMVDAPDEQVQQFSDTYTRFLSEAVLPWMPRFFEAVAADPRAHFYAAAARAARHFMEIDVSAVQDTEGEGVRAAR